MLKLFKCVVSAFWERGSPDLPACGLRRGSSGDPVHPSSSTQAQDPREGPSLAGRTTGSFLKGSLFRKAREEADRSRQGTSRGAHDASHDNQDQAGARRAPACAVSLFPLWCKGTSTGKGIGKRLPFRCNETKTRRTMRRRSPWIPARRHHRAFGRRRLLLSG